MTSIKRLIYKLDSTFLRFPFWFLYFLASHIVKMSLCCSNAQVWIRNSYYLKSLVVGLSDLDVTVAFKEKPTSLDIERLEKKYALLKKLIPFLGELNVLSWHELDFIKSIFNHYECQRDPYLSSLVNKTKNDRQFDALSFLLRMFEADLHNLKSQPHYRIKKWKSHLNPMGVEVKAPLNPEIILEKISKLAQLKNSDLDSFLKSLISNEKEALSEEDRLFSILFPHRWAVWANVNGGLEELIKENNYSKQESEIILTLLRWELMGLYTQFRILPKEQNIDFYVDLLYRFSVAMEESCTEKEKSNSADFKSLCIIVEEWQR